MDVNRKIWLKEQVQEYVEQLAEKGFVVDEEHKIAFLELLMRFYENGGGRSADYKEIVKFVTKYFIVRPLVKQIIETGVKEDMLSGKVDERL